MATQVMLKPAPAPVSETGERKPRRRRLRGGNWPVTIILAVCSLSVFIPLYVTLAMAFKTTSQAVDGNAFSSRPPSALTALSRPGR